MLNLVLQLYRDVLRNITHFGSTTLRPTTAYNMLQLCDIQPGDVVIDPMCGTGAIPIEGALEWSNNFYIAGEMQVSLLSLPRFFNTSSATGC